MSHRIGRCATLVDNAKHFPKVFVSIYTPASGTHYERSTFPVPLLSFGDGALFHFSHSGEWVFNQLYSFLSNMCSDFSGLNSTSLSARPFFPRSRFSYL